jgi:septal ring factor EnvC (AmiA/AmiB activator)
MRAIREQPRLVIARALATLCLVAAGIALGAVTRDDGRDKTQAAQARLVSAEQSAREQRAELGRVRAELGRVRTELDRVIAARKRSVHALHRQRAVNDRLRRSLRLARRAVQRRTQQP